MKNSLECEKEGIFLVICSYCEKILNGPEIEKTVSTEQEKVFRLRTSHAICPDCLYKKFPREYLAIQEKLRLRIKNSFKKGYSHFSTTLAKNGRQGDIRAAGGGPVDREGKH